MPAEIQAFYPIVVTEHLQACREYERFRRGGAPLILPLRDEPFGQRRFGLFDPAGTWIDAVEQIESAPGWWDRYLLERAGTELPPPSD